MNENMDGVGAQEDMASTSGIAQATATPPPPPPRAGEQFFNSAPGGERKQKGSNGCFWTLIIAIVAIFMIVLVVGALIAGSAMESMSSAFGKLSEGGFAQPSKYQEVFISGKRASQNKIAVVQLKGIITSGDDSGFSSQGASAASINARLRHILNDNNVKALIIRIDSPGGEVTASDEIYHMVRRIRKERRIPVIASMGSLAASGGYYVACACDRIIAHRMTTTGSIGVIVQTFKYYELFKKIGLQGEAFTSGPMKDMLNGERPTTPEEKEIVDRLVMDVYEDFVKVVAEGRPQLTEENIRNSVIGDGRVFLGVQAEQYGLVDSLGYFEDAVAQAVRMADLGDDYKVLSLNTPFSLAMLFGQMEARSGSISLSLPGSSSFKLESGKIYLLPREFAETR